MPPEFDALLQKYRFCYHCPDATVRNGKLTPVCVADRVNPLPDDDREPETVLSQAAYEHLGHV